MDAQDKEEEVQNTVTKTFQAIGVEVKYDGARSIEIDWKGRKLILVKMKDLGEKIKVMKNKLVGEECYIEDDMSRED